MGNNLGTSQGDRKELITGVGKDEPMVTSEKGGKQSASPYAFNLQPPKAIFAAAQVLKQGADKYGANNWRLIPTEDHISHCAQHLFAYLAGDTSNDHLSHAVVRALLAYEVDRTEKPDGKG